MRSPWSLSYIIRRVLEAVLTLWVIASLTFVMLRFLPGGPFDEEKALPPDVKASIERKYGLHDPFLTQYRVYMTGLLKGDLGESYKYVGRPVTSIIAETLPISAQLGALSLLLAMMIGFPLGLIAARNPNSWIDRCAMVFSISGVALPSFIVGPLLVMIFSFGVPFAALQGFLPPALWDGPSYMILPVVTLGLRPAGIIARMMRSSLLDVIKLDFVRTARAKGLPETVIMLKHVTRNAMVPVLSIMGPLTAGILSGSFVNEVIFAVPGMGKHFIQSVTNRDYPLVMGLTLVYAVLLVVANLIIDLLYVVADPRIQLD